MGDPHLTGEMTDEKLLMVRSEIDDEDNLSLIELAVIHEIERREIQS